jgi:hypothetical protein
MEIIYYFYLFLIVRVRELRTQRSEKNVEQVLGVRLKKVQQQVSIQSTHILSRIG